MSYYYLCDLCGAEKPREFSCACGENSTDECIEARKGSQILDAFAVRDDGHPRYYEALNRGPKKFWMLTSLLHGTCEFIEEWQYIEAYEEKQNKLAVAAVMRDQMQDLELWAAEPIPFMREDFLLPEQSMILS